MKLVSGLNAPPHRVPLRGRAKKGIRTGHHDIYIHLRRIRDLGTRVFDKANPIQPGLFLFGPYLENYFEKEVKRDHTKIVTAILDSPRRELSVRSHVFVVHSSSGLFGN